MGLAGESGCGKTTLAIAATALLEPPGRLLSGKILYQGTDLGLLSLEELRSLHLSEISMVFQASMNVLNPVARIQAQFLDAMKAHGIDSKEEALRRAREMFDRVKLPLRFLEAYPHQLSGGMRQRAVIALALVLRPKLVFLDEPTTALDVVVQRSIIQMLNELRQELGFGVVFITHDLSLLIEIADRIAIMYAGSIVEEAPAKALYEHPDHPYTVALMNAFPPLGTVHKRLEGLTGQPPDLRQLPPGCSFAPRCPRAHRGHLRGGRHRRRCGQTRGTGSSATCSARKRPALVSTLGSAGPPADAEAEPVPVLQVSGLTKIYSVGKFGRAKIVHALTDVDLSVAKGEVVGLVGESGSGKTTFARTVAFLERPTSGEVRLLGQAMPPRPSQARLREHRRQVQMIFQDPYTSLDPLHKIRYTVSRPLRTFGVVPRSAQREAVEQLLTQVGLVPPRDFLNRYPYQLSGGQRQRVFVARALRRGRRCCSPTSPLRCSTCRSGSPS